MAAERWADTLVVEGATLIDGTGAVPLPDSVIAIENGRITGVGRRGDVEVPREARVIDATGKFVIPGLIDGHTHWRGWTGELFLNHGVTTIVDLGNPTEWIRAAKRAERDGLITGPRIFTAAGAIGARRELREKGLFGSGGTPPYVYEVAGTDEARAATRALIDKGADIIKIFSDLDADDILAVVDEAHRSGATVIGHSADVNASLDGGMDGVTHLWGVSATVMTPENRERYDAGSIACPYAWAEPELMDALIERMVRLGSFLNPCLVNEHQAVLAQTARFEQEGYALLMRPELRYVPLDAMLSCLTFWHKVRNYDRALGSFPYVESLPDPLVEEFRTGYRRSQEFVRRYVAAGGRIFAGTDSAGSASLPGLSLHQELELLVEAGMTPMRALQAATATPAEMVGALGELGTVEAGKLGDLVILEADPLADIRNSRRISTVVKGGNAFEPVYHRHFSTPFMEVEGIGHSSSTPPPPSLSGIDHPTPEILGSGVAFDLTVRGSFHSTSLVEIDGRALETSFVSASELRARVTPDRVATAGVHSVTVRTPWPGGGRSNTRALTSS
jgi:imidazolonepropionase-like amidohydrolase